MFKSVYQHRETGKKVNVRNIDSSYCIVCDIENEQEIKIGIKAMRRIYKYIKKESNHKRFASSDMFFKKGKHV